jgi:hypothetical protein
VYEEDNVSVVSAIDPFPAMGVVDNPELKPTAERVQARLRSVIDSLGSN